MSTISPTPRPDNGAVILHSGDRSALVRVPYEHRDIPKSLAWRKWVPEAKAWRVLSQDIDWLIRQLVANGCPVRWSKRAGGGER